MRHSVVSGVSRHQDQEGTTNFNYNLYYSESLSNEHTSPPPLIHLDKVEGMKGCFRLVHRGIVTQKNARLRIPPLPNAISELLSLPPQLPRCDPR